MSTKISPQFKIQALKTGGGLLKKKKCKSYLGNVVDFVLDNEFNADGITSLGVATVSYDRHLL